MRYTAIASCAFLVASLPAAAYAAQTYPGCATPSLNSSHRTFYVDPAKGSAGGDGSMAKPWRTLAEVFSTGKVSTMGHRVAGGTDALTAVNAKGPVKAGDVIMLMSGNHGSISITNNSNTDFVTIMAAPGQTPVITDLTINSSSKWAFQGLKIQSAETPTTKDLGKRSYQPLVWISRSSYFGPTSDIVFDNDSFSSTDDTRGWSDNDWLMKTKYYAISLNASCVSVTNSNIYNVLNGVMNAGKNVLFQGNTIRLFANDGIDIAAGNMIIRGNTIKDGTNVASSPWHADGIQGWSLTSNGSLVTNENVLIEDNTIIKYGDPNKSAMQGISIYDGKWKNVTIQNNVVVSNIWNAIAVSGLQNAKIMNNTVVASEPVKHQSWISVNTSSGGVSSSNVVVRNNITPSMVLPNTGVTYDHNVVGGTYTLLANGKAQYQKTSDVGKAITIVPSYESLFTTVDNKAGVYDLRLKPSSSILGKGSADGMPALDIMQRPRTAPLDPGAYAR